MVDGGIAKYFGMGEALGIIATMTVVLYFSRKQMQALSVAYDIINPACKKCGEPNFLTPYAFWNITDFGAKCEKCETINYSLHNFL